jgi:hypothetical protein
MTTATLGDMRQATAIARHWIDGNWRDSAGTRTVSIPRQVR